MEIKPHKNAVTSFKNSFVFLAICLTPVKFFYIYNIALFVFNNTNNFKSCCKSVEKNYKILNTNTAQNIACLYLRFKGLLSPFFIYPSIDTEKIF